MHELLPKRDLVKDGLGNYYEIHAVTGNKIILVNAVVSLASQWLIDEDYCKNHSHETVAQNPTNVLKNKIERLNKKESPGTIFILESLQEKYDIVVDGLYERNPIV